MDKSQALIRDIARLFIKYKLSDWRIVIDALRDGGSEYDAIADAIANLTVKPRAYSKRKNRPGAAQFFNELKKTDAQKAEMLIGLYERFNNKTLAPQLADLREFCIDLGVKESTPKRREDLVLFVLRHLETLSDDALRSSLEMIPVRDRNYQDEYNKWFQMIYTSR